MVMFPVNCAQLVLQQRVPRRLLLSSRSLSPHGWQYSLTGDMVSVTPLLGDMAGAETSVAAPRLVCRVNCHVCYNPEHLQFRAPRILPFDFESANSVGCAFICFRVVDACKLFEDFFRCIKRRVCLHGFSSATVCRDTHARVQGLEGHALSWPHGLCDPNLRQEFVVIPFTVPRFLCSELQSQPIRRGVFLKGKFHA